MFDFQSVGAGVSDSGNSRCGYLHNFVSHVSKFVEAHGGISRGENHPNVGREALQKKFAEKGVVVGRRTELVPEELLHTSEQLCGLAVAELFSTDQLLQLALFRGCLTFDQFSLEGIVRVLGGRLE